MYRLEFLFWLSLTNVLVNAATNQCEDSCSPEVTRFQEYVAINTTIGADFSLVVDFWKRLARQESVQIEVCEYVDNYPIIILKYPGLNSSLSSIMLNAHTDVVPAYYEDGWTYPPFSGSINEDCEVVGRGTQDMKSNAIQYFEAMNRFKYNNVQLLRDVYIVLTPDESAGSMNGEALFVNSEEFEEMNVGFALDVGTPKPDPAITVFYQDKTTWGLRVDCYGQTTTSGLLLNPNITAGGSCGSFYRSYMEYKQSEYEISLNRSDFASYTVINFVGGCNPAIFTVIPAHLTMYYAIFLDRRTSVQEFNQTLQEWARKAGGDIRLTTEVLIEKAPPTKIDSSNPYWVALKDVFDDLNIQLNPKTLPLATDGNYIVRAGIPTLGLSPQPNTPLLVYSVNERLSIRTFLEGICIYEQLIQRIANLSDDQVGDDPKQYINYSEN